MIWKFYRFFTFNLHVNTSLISKMCETMTNIPTEDRSSCVLTEDMFDAAMNQQFTYQNDVESEEELSSQEENMEIDQDTQESSQECSESAMECNPPESVSSVIGKDSTVSVLVIETGLDKTKKTPDSSETTTTLVQPVDCLNNSNDSSHEENTMQLQTTLGNNDNPEAVVINSDSDVEKLPLLKKILLDTGNTNENDTGTSLEPIDLCDSDSEEFSNEDELPGVELIDDELKSVMENNLLAEIGMIVHNQKSPDPVSSKTAETSPPKIAVKSMAHIPSDIFNTLPQNKVNNIVLNRESMSSSSNLGSKICENSSITSLSEGRPLCEKDEIPTTIHINRIAVPHTNFITSQGQKMKCVYLRNSSSVPVVINSPNNNFVATTQLKKMNAKQVPPIVALSNMAVKNTNQKKMVVAKTPSNMIAIAPKLQKPPSLKNAPQRPHQFALDQTHDALIKSLLFHNLKKPYYPADELAPYVSTFLCMDCRDRFVLQSSLDQHLARRSLSIRYWCRICKSELQFFNRCVFLKHLRAHQCSIKNIDTTCITFSPLPQDMIESGVASSFLRDSKNDFPANQNDPKKNVKSGLQNNSLSRVSGCNTEVIEKSTSSVIVPNPSSSNIVTVSGQSKSICFQTKTSVSSNKPIPSPAISSESNKKDFPMLMPKKTQISPLVQKQTKDEALLIKKQIANNVFLVRNSVPGSSNKKPNTSPTNKLSEAECIDIDDDLVIDDDTMRTTDNKEEEEVDIENVTENNIPLLADIKTTQKTKSSTKAASTSLRRNCSECGISCLNINKHLTGSNRPVNPILACEVCNLILPTKCALRIHARIHMKLPPYKCPDCGKDFKTWDDLNAHVKFSCGHLAKCVRYICLSCKAHFASPTNLGNHISNTHSRNIYKCILCPVAFFSRDSLNKHLKTIHRNESALGMDYRQCSMCPKKLVPIDKFESHVIEHTKGNNVLIYGYKCPLCSIVFANKTAFIIHQIKEKREMEAKAAHDIDKNKCVDSVDQEVGMQETTQLSDSNSDIEDEPVIVKKYAEPGDDSPMTEKDPLSLDGWEHAQEQQVNEKREELCIMCKKNAVFLLPGINPNNQSLCCKQCVKPIDTFEYKSKKQLTHYTNGLQSIKNSLNKQGKHNKDTPKAVQRSLSCDDAKTLNNKRKSFTSIFPESDYLLDTVNMPAKKKSRKKQHKDKSPNVTKQTHIQGQVVDSNSPDELLCAKCEFVADSKETFLSHIAVHRTDPTTFQCLECGLCFVVLPSLERHLQINHGIKDVNMYTYDNRGSLPLKFVSTQEEPEETDDNQCRVCHEVFDSSSSLEKHFRSHGMAFMNSLIKSP